jgi:hypothetical protein
MRLRLREAPPRAVVFFAAVHSYCRLLEGAFLEVAVDRVALDHDSTAVLKGLVEHPEWCFFRSGEKSPSYEGRGRAGSQIYRAAKRPLRTKDWALGRRP